MATGPTGTELGAHAPDFRLPATDGRTYALKDVAGEKGAVIVFICNHCPYVKAVIGRLVADARLLMGEGVGFAAIGSNDAARYPEDSFANMREFARRHHFPFPYLRDESQDAARAFGAVCTPDFFGYDRSSSSNIAAGSMKAALRRRLPARAANSSRRCAPSPRPGPRLPIRPPPSAVRSSGSNSERRKNRLRSRPRPHPPKMTLRNRLIAMAK